MEPKQDYKEVKFLDLNTAARADALKQMAAVHEQEQIYDASTAEDFANMIVNGYSPDRDFMFLQYIDDSPDMVRVHFKAFS